MPASQLPTQIESLELKCQIERKLGSQAAEKYFSLLNRFLSLKLGKSQFDKFCIDTLGRENIGLHNQLIRVILKNSCFPESAPSKESKTGGSLNVKVANGYQRSSLQSLCRDVFSQSPRKGRTLRDRKFRDRPSPLGPLGKVHSAACEDSVPKIHEQQSASELLSFGSRPPGEVISVEDGEEVDQAAGSPGIHSRSPVRAPLGVCINMKGTKKARYNEPASASYAETCYSRGELPDNGSLRNRLEQKLEKEGLKVSMDCVNLLNTGLDVYLKRLIKPCLESAGSRSGHKSINREHGEFILGLNGLQPVRYLQKQTRCTVASILDFRVAMELNPQILGEDWPVQLEKVCMRAAEESTE